MESKRSYGSSCGQSHTHKILLNVEKPDPERFWPKPGTNGMTRTNCSIFDETYDAPIRRVTTDCYRKVITYEPRKNILKSSKSFENWVISTDSRWYYWQLPQDQVTVVTRLTVWLLYVIHQVAHWTLLWFAQKERADSNVEKEAYYSGKLRWYNWALLGVTYLFHVLHESFKLKFSISRLHTNI